MAVAPWLWPVFEVSAFSERPLGRDERRAFALHMEAKVRKRPDLPPHRRGTFKPNARKQGKDGR